MTMMMMTMILMWWRWIVLPDCKEKIIRFLKKWPTKRYLIVFLDEQTVNYGVCKCRVLNQRTNTKRTLYHDIVSKASLVNMIQEYVFTHYRDIAKLLLMTSYSTAAIFSLLPLEPVSISLVQSSGMVYSAYFKSNKITRLHLGYPSCETELITNTPNPRAIAIDESGRLAPLNFRFFYLLPRYI